MGLCCNRPPAVREPRSPPARESMIRSVRFENFRCLREVELSLAPLTVLVGPSGSGKTSVLEGLQYRMSCEHSDYWRLDTTQPISLQWTFLNGTQVRLSFPLTELD